MVHLSTLFARTVRRRPSPATRSAAAPEAGSISRRRRSPGGGGGFPTPTGGGGGGGGRGGLGDRALGPVVVSDPSSRRVASAASRFSLASRLQKGSGVLFPGLPTFRSVFPPLLISSNTSSTRNVFFSACLCLSSDDRFNEATVFFSPTVFRSPRDRPASSPPPAFAPSPSSPAFALAAAASTFLRSFLAAVMSPEKSRTTFASRSGSWCVLILAASSPKYVARFRNDPLAASRFVAHSSNVRDAVA